MQPLNEFYSISMYGQKPQDEYQLENLGVERVTTAFSKRISGGRNAVIDGPLTTVTKDDYDGAFAFKLTQVKPPYLINKTIEYHLNFYVRSGGDRAIFIKQMKYVIIPYFQKYKYSEVHLQLLNEWIEENEPQNKKTKMSSLNWIHGFVKKIFDLPIIHYDNMNIINPFNNYWFKSAEIILTHLKIKHPEHNDKHNYLLEMIEAIKKSKEFVPRNIIDDLLSKKIIKQL